MHMSSCAAVTRPVLIICLFITTRIFPIKDDHVTFINTSWTSDRSSYLNRTLRPGLVFERDVRRTCQPPVSDTSCECQISCSSHLLSYQTLSIVSRLSVLKGCGLCMGLYGQYLSWTGSATSSVSIVLVLIVFSNMFLCEMMPVTFVLWKLVTVQNITL